MKKAKKGKKSHLKGKVKAIGLPKSGEQLNDLIHQIGHKVLQRVRAFRKKNLIVTKNLEK